MGFLVFPDGSPAIDMSKVVVSLWFRVPQATIDKVSALPLPRNGAYGFSEPNTWPVLQKIATLLSWDNPQQQGTVWHWTQQPVGSTYNDADVFVETNYAPFPTDQQTGSMAPSYIGMDFSDATNVRIAINLQSSNKPDFTNYEFALTTWNVLFINRGAAGGYLKETLIHTDATYTLAFPLTIGALAGPGVPNITANVWHHLLISWDVTGSLTCGGDSLAINSPFKMYFALDDVNYDKGGMPANWIGDVINSSDGNPGSAGTDPHTVVTTDNALNHLPWPADPGVDEFSYYSNPLPPGSFNGSMGPLPARRLCVPGHPYYTDDNDARGPINSIYKVEMAELAIFTGVTLDTSVEKNRRIFIGPKSADSLPPGSPSVGSGTNLLYPINPKAAETFFGKKPSIMFHGSNNWIKGRNTGSLGIDANGKPITGGQFMPTGTIKKYTPDPSITP